MISKIAENHLKKTHITDIYLITHNFTIQQLQEIAEYKKTPKKPEPKPKIISVDMSPKQYADYLKLSQK